MSKPRDIKKDLAEYLRELHLPAISRCFEDKARQAERETLAKSISAGLVERECQERREKRIARLLQASKLPLVKTLDSFRHEATAAERARQTKALLDARFGPAGKRPRFRQSWERQDASAFGAREELIRQGRRVAFSTCVRLVQDLLRAKQALRSAKPSKTCLLRGPGD